MVREATLSATVANLFRGMEQHGWHFANASVEPQDAKIIYYSPSCAPIEEKRSQACDQTLKPLKYIIHLSKVLLHQASSIQSVLYIFCPANSGNKTYKTGY